MFLQRISKSEDLQKNMNSLNIVKYSLYILCECTGIMEYSSTSVSSKCMGSTSVSVSFVQCVDET
jgi:hypothetical protein